jgi:predicted N-acetyltransferase YhbS
MNGRLGNLETPWLAQLFVEPTRRRHGVGATLVRAVLRRAEDCGYRRIYLYSR